MTTDRRAVQVQKARSRRAHIAAGTWQPFVAAQPVRDHVNKVRGAGVPLRTLAAKTYVGIGTLNYLMYGDEYRSRPERIRTEAARALLAYWPTLDDYDPNTAIPATGTIRRLQALTAIGWTMHQIQPHLTLTAHSLDILRRGDRASVRAASAREIRDVYRWASASRPEHHGAKAYVAKRARNHAARNGWHGPCAWDDIDDPHAEPEVDTTSQGSRAAAITEDWEWLERQGYSREHAADRLGIHPQTLQAAISRTRRARTQTDMETAA